MLLSRITFGTGEASGQDRDSLENIATLYLATLTKHGQICGEYLYSWLGGVLTAYVHLADADSISERHHSEGGLRTLREVLRAFGRTPEVEIIDDGFSHSVSSWETSSSLYLTTFALDDLSPVRCGTTGDPIPPYLLPLSQELIDGISVWSYLYHRYAHVWLSCIELEMSAYKQFADPGSELSTRGRNLCEAIELATGKPTFYYVTRYYGRRENEQIRPCPVCGGEWHVCEPPAESDSTPVFFPFRCDRCRLISDHACATDDERHARIGEYRPRS